MAKSATAKKPNLFAKSKEAVSDAAPKAKAKKGTSIELPIVVSSDPTDVASHRKMTPACCILHNSVTDVIQFSADEKSAKGKGNTAKGRVIPTALDLFAHVWVETGVQPETPVRVSNDLGEQLTFIISNKSGQYDFSQEQVDEMTALVGPEKASEMYSEVTKFVFNPAMLADEAIANKVSAALTKALGDAAGELLVPETKLRVNKGTLPRLVEFVGKDTERLKAALAILGSTAPTYVQA